MFKTFKLTVLFIMSWILIISCKHSLFVRQEALTTEEKLHEQKDAELKQFQKEIEILLQEKRVYLQALEEEKKRNCIQVSKMILTRGIAIATLGGIKRLCFAIQTEHLVDQQILITRLRSNHTASTDGSSGVSVDAGASRTSDRRPYSVPLIGHNCRYGPIRRVRSCSSLTSLSLSAVVVDVHTIHFPMCAGSFTPVPWPTRWRG